ncbi:PE-PGRS family protein [Streptomyces sp. NPDC005962]|uniref:PE-PGRS family protein n=1 Tax=Streptomyces sp. NPDC005962 TaxID=3154466 RepID=UPI0033DDF228
MRAQRKPDHDQSSAPSRTLARPAPARATALPDAHAGPGGAMTPGRALALQGSVGNAVASRMIERERHVHGAGCGHETPVQRAAVQQAAVQRAVVQRVGESSASGAVAEQPAEPAQDAQEAKEPKGKEVIKRLSRSIEGHTIEKKPVVSPWAPGTWYPEQWMPQGKTRLRRTLDRRVLAGEVFGAQDLADIEELTTVNPDWLKDVGIGTTSEAQAYTRKGDYKDWLKLPAGKRVLTATLAYNNHLKGAPIPDTPDYTLARFFNTKGRNLTEDQKQPLKDERDQQIRDTAVRTLHPAAIPPQNMHADADKSHVTQHQEKADKARDVFTNVLLVLQHGLKIYDKKQKKHLDFREGDVVRALAHGGRVNIRIPAVSEGEPTSSLTDFLGVTEGGGLAAHVEPRDYATHGNDIGKNKGDKRGKFKETGGTLVAVGNKILPGGPVLAGLDIPGGGFGSKDWNGDVVLPTGSHGHMLLVFTAPTREKDGALQVGIETTGPGKPSTVGYKHDFRSTEATANPESVLHGHKRDKFDERYVDLKELGKAQGGGDWRAFLDDIKQGWYAELNKTTDGSDERQALYQQLVGRRQNFYPPAN